MGVRVEPLELVQNVEVLEEMLRQLDSQIYDFIWDD